MPEIGRSVGTGQLNRAAYVTVKPTGLEAIAAQITSDAGPTRDQNSAWAGDFVDSGPMDLEGIELPQPQLIRIGDRVRSSGGGGNGDLGAPPPPPPPPPTSSMT